MLHSQSHVAVPTLLLFLWNELHLTSQDPNYHPIAQWRRIYFSGTVWHGDLHIHLLHILQTLGNGLRHAFGGSGSLRRRGRPTHTVVATNGSHLAEGTHLNSAAARTRGDALEESAQRACERSSERGRGAAGSPDPGEQQHERRASQTRRSGRTAAIWRGLCLPWGDRG